MLRQIIGRGISQLASTTRGSSHTILLTTTPRVMALIATRHAHWLEDDTRKKVSPQLALDRAQRYNHEGLGLYRQNKYYDAQDRLTQAIYLFKLAHDSLQTSERDQREILWRPMSYLALAQHGAGNFEEAVKSYDAVLEHLRSLYGANDPRELRILSNQANIQMTLGNYSEAEVIARQVVDGTTQLKGASHEMTAIAQLNLASVCACIGTYQADKKDVPRWADEALALLEQAEKTLRSTLGSDNGYVEAVIENRAQVFRMLKKPVAEVGRLRSQFEDSRSKIEVAPPTELPNDLIEQYKPKWSERAAPQRSCDPRGFMIEPEVLQHELREFTKVWRAASLPWSAELAPVLRSWTDAIAEGQQTLQRAADEEKLILDTTRDAVKAMEEAIDPETKQLIAQLKEMRDAKQPMTAEERAQADELLVEKTPLEKAKEVLPNVLLANYAKASPIRYTSYKLKQQEQEQQQ